MTNFPTCVARYSSLKWLFRNPSSAPRPDTHTGCHREHAQWHHAPFEVSAHLSQLSCFPVLWHSCLFIPFLHVLYLLHETFLLTRLRPSGYHSPASPNPRTPTHQLWDHISDVTLCSVSCSEHQFRMIISSCIRHWIHKTFTMYPFIHSENNLDHVYERFHIPDNPLKTFHL